MTKNWEQIWQKKYGWKIWKKARKWKVNEICSFENQSNFDSKFSSAKCPLLKDATGKNVFFFAKSLKNVKLPIWFFSEKPFLYPIFFLAKNHVFFFSKSKGIWIKIILWREINPIFSWCFGCWKIIFGNYEFSKRINYLQKWIKI